jgi:hypothetical protein
MSFRNAVTAAPAPVSQAFCVGKQALKGEHRRLIICGDDARITGSLDLDSALAILPKYAQSPRWDYGVGHRMVNGHECAIWVEVHSASTGEVGTVLRKLTWLKSYLAQECQALWEMTLRQDQQAKAFVWVASGGVHINRNSPQARRLAQAGLGWPQKILRLP